MTWNVFRDYSLPNSESERVSFHISGRATESANRIALKPKRKMVGAAGFEPTTP